jgi:hypothetical protein
MATVITVVYETDKAVFRFTVEDVRDHLNRNKPGYDGEEVTALKDLLSSARVDSITIPGNLRLFPHIALNLIRDSNGTAYCMACGKTYGSSS